jgi:hypothetical protein
MPNPPDDVDPRRVRLGLAFLAVVMVVAVGIFMATDDALGRLVTGFIIVFTLGRAWFLRRALKRGGGRLSP